MQKLAETGRGKRQRGTVLSPVQLASVLGGGRSGSDSGSDFAVDAAETRLGSETDTDTELESETGEEAAPVEEGVDDEEPEQSPIVLRDKRCWQPPPLMQCAACQEPWMYESVQLIGVISIP